MLLVLGTGWMELRNAKMRWPWRLKRRRPSTLHSLHKAIPMRTYSADGLSAGGIDVTQHGVAQGERGLGPAEAGVRWGRRS